MSLSPRRITNKPSSSTITTKIFQRNGRNDNYQPIVHDPPEISWENSLGAPNGVPFDEPTKELLKACLEVKLPSPTTLTEIIKRSENFPVPFPVSNVRCRALRDRGIGMDTLEVRYTFSTSIIRYFACGWRYFFFIL